MNILITYAESKVSTELRNRLADVGRPFFIPFNKLVMQDISESDNQVIDSSKYLLVTSNFVANMIKNGYININRDSIVIALKAKIATTIHQAISNQIVVANDANEMKVIDGLRADDLLKATLFLRGNRSLIDDSQLKIHQLIVYRNEWNQKNQLAVMKQLGTRNYQKVLVTSPSNFRRLIDTKLSFINDAEYYTLGKATQDLIRDVLDVDAYCATGPRRLEDAVNQMCDDLINH